MGTFVRGRVRTFVSGVLLGAVGACFLLSARDAGVSPQPWPLSAAVSSTPPPAAFDPRHYPALVINLPSAYAERKWAESQLARVGYSS